MKARYATMMPHLRAVKIFPAASWSAPAERSGDGAFARAGRFRINKDFGPGESGVALRFPPQSMTRREVAMPLAIWAGRIQVNQTESSLIKANKAVETAEEFPETAFHRAKAAVLMRAKTLFPPRVRIGR